MRLELDQAPQRPQITYDTAFAVAQWRIEALQAAGLMTRASDITDEWEQDNHFDDLEDIFAHTCRVFGLAWPPEQVG